MVAKMTIEVGEELLFDYGDRKSTAAFLRACPVCSPAVESTAVTSAAANAEEASTSSLEPQRKRQRKDGENEVTAHSLLKDVSSSKSVSHCISEAPV